MNRKRLFCKKIARTAFYTAVFIETQPQWTYARRFFEHPAYRLFCGASIIYRFRDIFPQCKGGAAESDCTATLEKREVFMFTKFEIGQRLETTVAAVSGECIFLDLNAKSEGILDAAELCGSEGSPRLKAGDPITVFFAGERDGEMHFTAKITEKNADADMLLRAFENHIPVEGRVEKEIKGGFEIQVGQTRAFCPYSQMGFRERKMPSEYIGAVRTFSIIEYSADGKKFVVSNRAVQEAAHNAELAALKQRITEGAVMDATVTELHDFGAFVELGGCRALLPVSEISLQRIADIHEALQTGQKVSVKVMKTDWQHERISVSIKALLTDPWEHAAQKYRAGDKIDGVISGVTDFGFFVTLEPGINGLVHISTLKNIARNTNLKKIYREGTPLSVCIKEVDAAKKRIALIPTESTEEEQSAAEYLNRQDDSESYNPFAALLKK